MVRDDMSGHRARMKRKCDDKGVAALSDQELFEIMLYPLLPRIDTKPIVKACFREFKSFSGILNAPHKELLAIKGMGSHTVRHIKATAELLERLSFERIINKNFLTNWTELQSYCI